MSASHSKGTKVTKVFQRSRRDLWLLRTVALVISILLWITVYGGKKGEISKRISLDYQLPKGLTIGNQVPHEVTFRIAGPRAFLREFQDRPVTIPVDLSTHKGGEYQVSLGEELLDVPLGLRVISISQSNVTVKLEHMSSKRVPVRAVFGEAVPEGLKVSGLTVKPATVEIRGALSRLQSLDAVPTDPIPLSPTAVTQEYDVNLAVADFPGMNIEEQNRVVHVHFELHGPSAKKWFKDVPVQVRLESDADLHPDTKAESKNLDLKNLGIKLRPDHVSLLVEGPENILTAAGAQSPELWVTLEELKAGTFKLHLESKIVSGLHVLRKSAESIEVAIPAK